VTPGTSWDADMVSEFQWIG